MSRAPRPKVDADRVIRALIYVRLSSYKGESDPSTSPLRQEETCRAYAQSKRWEVVNLVQDLDESGSSHGKRLKRPGLELIRGQWERFDVVLVSKLDRLARNVKDFIAFAEEAHDHGVDLVSVGDNIDMTTPAGEFFATMLAALAALEANTISERSRAGKAAAASLHRWTGGPPPYGYRSAPLPGTAGVGLVVNPEEAAVVRDMARLVLDGGTMYGAVKRLNLAGVAPRKAATWRINSLVSALTGDQILGRLRFRGDVLRGEDGLPIQVWEPILTIEEVQQLRAHLRPRSPARPRRGSGKRLLSGIVRCGSCEQRMYVDSRKTAARYACTGGGCRRPVTIGAHLIEPYVEEAFRTSTLMWYPTWTRVESSIEDPRVALVEEEIARLAQTLSTPGANVSEIGIRLAELGAQRELQVAERPKIKGEVILGPSLRSVWHAAPDTDAKRRILEANIERLTIGPGTRGPQGLDPTRVTLRFRQPVDEQAQVGHSYPRGHRIIGSATHGWIRATVAADENRAAID